MSNYKFSGHQTFVFRYGWLVKGVALVRENPHGFLEDDAIVKLGVGKNMVESIKYWCTQTGLIEDADVPGTMRLTEFAKFIFGKKDGQGVDPYMEDDATIWLLHYNLVADAAESTWSIVFNYLNKPEFTKGELLGFMQRHLFGKCTVSDNTLERDIDCFVRSYAGTRGKQSEENFDCPLLGLSLIQPTNDSDLFRISICAKRNLPVELIGYAILKRMERGDTIDVNVHNMLFEPYSPGEIFKLDENSLIDAVSELEKLTKGKLQYTETSGMHSIRFTGSKKETGKYAQGLLEKYYGVK